MTQGDLFKDLGQKDVLDHSQTEWKDVAIVELIKISNSCETFTSDDLREALAECDITPPHPNAIGAIMSAAGKMHLIKKTGDYVKSARLSSHSRIISRWRKA